MSGQEIDDGKSLKPNESKTFAKKPRICVAEGVGTFATQTCARLAEIAVEMDATHYMNHVFGLDNDIDSVYRARVRVEALKPKRRLFRRGDRFKAFFQHLPGIKTNVGFNRDLEASLESMPRYYGVLRNWVRIVKEHDKANGIRTMFQLRPTSLSGGHAGSPQWLLNLELRSQGFEGMEIGLITIPKDVVSVSIFKQVFPLMLASKSYGFKASVIWDNSLADSHRTVQKQDEMVLRGIIGLFRTHTWDTTLPGPGDILRVLINESNGFIGIVATEEEITVKRRFRRKISDRDTVIEGVRRGLTRVMNDTRTRLLDAEAEKAIPQFIVVTGNFWPRDYHEALDQALLPRNVTPLLAPSKRSTVTVARFYPLKTATRSINRLWNLPIRKRQQSILPDEIIQKSIESVWPLVEKTADFAGVTPETLLEGK